MKHFFNRRSLILFLLLGTFVLAACQKSPPPPQTTNPHPLTAHQRSLVSQIRRSGAHVFQQGEMLQIVLPTDTFFLRSSARVRPNKRYAVNRVAMLVKSYIAPYRHPRIRVTGYTDRVFPQMTRKKLSTEYAREISAYLWRKGVPQRWVRIHGRGAAEPIATDRTPRGAAYNRRVVIQVN